MSGDAELDDLLGPEPVSDDGDNNPPEVLVDDIPASPKSRPMGALARAQLERSRSYPANRGARRNTPEMLQRLLNYSAEMPVTADVARRSGLSQTTIRYWLQKSLEGAPGDGFDVALGEADENGTDDNTVRFHDAWDLAMMAGVERVEQATIRRAMGYDEVLTYQGRVQYRYDPELIKAALEAPLTDGAKERPSPYNPENYLLDQYGAPVPETVTKMDPDLAMFILKTRKPQVYGNKATLDVNVKGGVLVVPMRVAPEELTVIEGEFRREGRPLITFEESDDDVED